MAQVSDHLLDLLIVGTYTKSLPHVEAQGTGIHLLGFDRETGAIIDGVVVSGLANPTYLTANKAGTRLYAVQEVDEIDGASVVVFQLDAAASSLATIGCVPALGSWPCHVSLDADEERLFISNYLSGSFAAYPLNPDGLPQEPGLKIQRTGKGVNPERQEGPHIHQGVATPDRQHVLVCDAGTDDVLRYPFAEKTIVSEPDASVRADPGSLPRHLALLPDGRSFAVVHELGGTIALHDTASLQRRTSVSTLPAGWDGAISCAAVRAHPSGRFVYASNRGHDSIVGFAVSPDGTSLEAIGWWSTNGATPRDFVITEDGRFLLAANQDGHNIVVFRIGDESGKLDLVAERSGIGSPVCLHLVSRD